MADHGAWVVASLAVQLGRTVVTHDAVEPALHAVIDAAPRIAEMDSASITVRDDGRYRTAVSTDTDIVRADELQYGLGEGPCVDATADADHYVIPDVATDDRWPRWGPAGVKVGYGQCARGPCSRNWQARRSAQPL